MKALSVVSKEKMELKNIEKPHVEPGKVIVKVAYVGICGSDLPRYFKGAVHSFPQILGHEFAGIVDEVGENVTSLKPGDRVAVAPLIPCKNCNYCKSGNPALCNNYSFIGSRQSGAMAEYVKVPEENCIKIPHTLSLKEAALIEPLTVAIHAIDRVKIPSGARCLIFGTGTIGLMTLLALKARGVGEIIGVDLNETKLSLAKKIGADIVINPSSQSLDDFFETHELPDVVIETAGSNVTQVQAIKYVKKRGKVVYVGTCTKNVTFPPEIFEKILRNELEITGSWMSYSTPFPGYEWKAGLSYMANKVIDVNPLITGEFTLEDKELPFKKMNDKNSNHIKILYKIYNAN